MEDKKNRITILDLKPKGGVSELEAELIGDVIRSEIIHSKEFVVIAKSLFQKTKCISYRPNNANQEDKDRLDFNRAPDELCALEIGRANSAKFATYGYISKIDSKYNLVITLIDIESEEVIESLSKSFDSIDKLEVSAFSLANELIFKVRKNTNSEESSYVNKEHKKEKYFDKKYSLFFNLTGGSGYAKYDQPNEFFQSQYFVTGGDVLRAIPYTSRTDFKGAYGDGLTIGLNYRRNQKFSFSLNYSSVTMYFRSMGVDLEKSFYGSLLLINGFPGGEYYPYFPGKYLLGARTLNLGTDYYFYSNKNELEFYIGGEIGLGSFAVEPNALDKFVVYDSRGIVKLNIRTGMQYNFNERHHLKIEPFYSHYWGDRFHLNFIGANFAYMYTFGVSN